MIILKTWFQDNTNQTILMPFIIMITLQYIIIYCVTRLDYNNYNIT